MTANRIIQHIFQEPEIKQVDEAALEQLVTAYPYFTTARLLLAKKQYTAQRNLLAPAVKKAQLYSNNMHYFYRFITSVEPVAAPASESEIAVYTPAQDETVTTFPGTEEENEPVVEEPGVTPEPAPEEEPVIEEPAITPEPEEIPVIEEPTVTPEAIYEAPAIPTATEELPVIEEPTVTPEAEYDEPAIPTAPEELPVIEEPTVNPQAEFDEPVILTEPETTPVTPESSIYVSPAPTIMANTPVDTGAEEEQIRIFPLEMNTTEESTLTYQPLYTDDYFAYKRLKDPEQAEVLNEKGASEMKSFTSWLKDIKSTFSEKSSKQQYHQQLTRSYEDFDPEVSEAVEKMAMESITLTDDVVSETLAEIWAKQYQTAIHIYQKLSLLNPNKSAYFAQKIQEIQLLKDNN